MLVLPIPVVVPHVRQDIFFFVSASGLICVQAGTKNNLFGIGDTCKDNKANKIPSLCFAHCYSTLLAILQTKTPKKALCALAICGLSPAKILSNHKPTFYMSRVANCFSWVVQNANLIDQRCKFCLCASQSIQQQTFFFAKSENLYLSDPCRKHLQ